MKLIPISTILIITSPYTLSLPPLRLIIQTAEAGKSYRGFRRPHTAQLLDQAIQSNACIHILFYKHTHTHLLDISLLLLLLIQLMVTQRGLIHTNIHLTLGRGSWISPTAAVSF